MDNEENPSVQMNWSPADMSPAEAAPLVAAEQKRAARSAKSETARKTRAAAKSTKVKDSGEADGSSENAVVKPARKSRVRKAAADDSATNTPVQEVQAVVEGSEPKQSAAPSMVQSTTTTPPQAVPVAPNVQTVPQMTSAAPSAPAPSSVPNPQQQLAPEGPQQPLSKRQLRRQQWLANRAARQNGGRPGFNGFNNGNQNSPQGNRRPPQHGNSFQPPGPSVPRNPDLPEYKLADIHSWDNAKIVQLMMPDANAEDLGAMRRHEIIFAAIRSYLSRGGAVMASGFLKVEKEGYGFLRSAKTNFLACPEDVFIPQQQIRRHALRTGDCIEGPVRDPRDRDRFFVLGNVVTVNGKTPSEAARIVHFENLVPTFPTRRIVLETVPGEFSMRTVDLFTPIGFGQRGLIVAPPRVGKTVLLQKMANAISANHPDAMLIILLVDERPEEVTDMQRNTKAMVLSSTFDEEPQHHVDVADMVIEMSRRQVENGRDVIILLDSITRLARAYNTVQPHSGKILTGGVDALALHRPKRFFGAARNIEGGGSLTILATALIDTGSRMDEVIFEEFKGTGNMELVLDRMLADKRIFPAIDIEKSGTRKEDLLLAPVELEKTWALRRVLADVGPERAMQSVLVGMKKFRSNPEFLLSLDLKNL